MTIDQMKAWFSKTSSAKKKFAVLMIARELTIVLRDINNSKDTKSALAAAMLISELDHRLLAYVTDSMAGQPTFPDDVVVEIIGIALSDTLLDGAADHVWQSVTNTVDGIVDGVQQTR